MFTSPSQIMCTVLGVHIYYYGVIMAAAIAVGTLVSDYIATKYYEMKKDSIIDMAPYFIIFGIIGARLYYCLMDLPFYLRFPTEILAIRHGGISIHGAILGGFIGMWIYSKKHNISLKKICDISAVGLSLGQAIGRWGNFFNSEAYGTPTNLPWKLYIAPEHRQIPYLNNEYFHPAFLYESILDFVLFLILLYLIKQKNNFKEGNIALIYLMLYSVIRIITEMCRLDSVRYIFGVPVAIFVSVGIIILAVVLLRRSKKL